jgi:hypothetical protein
MIYRTMKPSSVLCGAPRCFCILYMDYVKFSNKQTITDGTKIIVVSAFYIWIMSILRTNKLTIIKIRKDFTARTLTHNTIKIKKNHE